MVIEHEFQELINVIVKAAFKARAYFDADDNENELKIDGSV